MRAGRQPWLSVMSTNIAIALVVGLLMALLGDKYRIMMAVAGSWSGRS